DGGAGTRAVFDDHRHAKLVLGLFGIEPRHDVDAAAGRKRHHDLDGLVGERAGLRDGWADGRDRSESNGNQPAEHVTPPSYITNLPPSSSSMWTRMISSKLRSTAKPSAVARSPASRCGQPPTMRTTSGSGSRRMRDATLSPATRRSASICSPTVQHTPGMVRL